MEEDPTQRFSDRVQHYLAYRPPYPVAMIDCLRDECRLTAASIIADVGSGTGIPMLLALRQLFQRSERQGQIQFEYNTRIFWGRLE